MLIPKSTTAPWYRICTTAKILETGDYVGEVNPAPFENHILIKRSTHAGYLPKGKFGVMRYRGRYGQGYIIASHNDTTTVMWEYYIDERGLPYGN